MKWEHKIHIQYSYNNDQIVFVLGFQWKVLLTNEATKELQEK